MHPGDNAEAGRPVVVLASGTLVLTSAGEVAIELLRAGDRILGLGAPRFITIPGAAQPTSGPGFAVRLPAGAAGPGAPLRDLALPPEQAVLVGGVLIPARACAGGTTEAAGPSWWRLTLDEPDMILANGAAVATPGYRAAAADAAPSPEAPPPATDDPCVHVQADDAVLWPDRRGAVLDFAVPPGCAHPRLRSRVGVPAEMLPGSADRRALGVAVDWLCVDGRTVALDDPALSAGWHRPDGSAPRLWRWTGGDALLPPGALISVRIVGTTSYPSTPAWRAPPPLTRQGPG